MIKFLKISLITLSVSFALVILVFFGLVFSLAVFFSNPSERDCIKVAEEFLDFKLGKRYQTLDYDAKYYHPDRMLSFTLKLPDKKFMAIVKYCEEQVKKYPKAKIEHHEDYDSIVSFIQTGNTFIKDQENVIGDCRLFYRRVSVLVDEQLITYSHSRY